MSFEFDEKMDKIFIEKIEDEEEYDDAFVSELEPEAEPEDSIYGDDETDEGISGYHWTNIPQAKIGKELKDLKKVKKPLENGWTVEELMSALKGNIIFMANRYASPNFGKEDGFMAGMEAVTDAIKTDKGMSFFTTHVYRYIQSKVKRASAGTKDFPTANVSGIKPNEGGKTDFLKATRATTSADAPLGGESEEMGSFASRISSDASSGAKAEEEQLGHTRLLSKLFSAEEVGLSSQQSDAMYATYGLSRKRGGGYTKTGKKSTAEIADALGVSKVRVSQIRASALKKIQVYVQDKNIPEEEMMAAFGLEETKLIVAANIVIESIRDILELEIELLQEYQMIPVSVVIGSVVRHANAKVHSDSLSVDDIIAEGGESILGSVSRDTIVEAQEAASIKLSSEYFSETVASIIQMHSLPILGIIGAKITDDEEEKTEEDNAPA